MDGQTAFEEFRWQSKSTEMNILNLGGPTYIRNNKRSRARRQWTLARRPDDTVGLMDGQTAFEEFRWQSKSTEMNILNLGGPTYIRNKIWNNMDPEVSIEIWNNMDPEVSIENTVKRSPARSARPLPSYLNRQICREKITMDMANSTKSLPNSHSRNLGCCSVASDCWNGL